ncbi:MAG: YihY/virulence factor BrkB family protein [Chitinophagaceae bacterium]|nr:YihY/virulence factor BrkB family protein [Chitinophagaceae bacterium]
MTKFEKLIITFPPIAFIIRKSKKIIIPGFQGLPLYDVVLFFFQQINKVGLNERAAAISFNFIMAIPAACILIFTLVPYLQISREFNAELLKLTKQLSPNRSTYLFVRDFLNDFFGTQRGGLLSFGILLVMFYASNAMMGIIRTFDKSIAQTKGWLFHKRWRAIKLTFLILLLLIGSILILVGQEQLAIFLKKLFGMKKKADLPWWNELRWIVIITLVFYSIAFIYKYAPSVHKRWKIASPGAILATFLLMATTILFSYWVNNFGNFNKVYGSIGTVLIIMTLVYFNSMVLIIGFELNVSITYLQEQVKARKLKEEQELQSKK